MVKWEKTVLNTGGPARLHRLHGCTGPDRRISPGLRRCSLAQAQALTLSACTLSLCSSVLAQKMRQIFSQSCRRCYSVGSCRCDTSSHTIYMCSSSGRSSAPVQALDFCQISGTAYSVGSYRTSSHTNYICADLAELPRQFRRWTSARRSGAVRSVGSCRSDTSSLVIVYYYNRKIKKV